VEEAREIGEMRKIIERCRAILGLDITCNSVIEGCSLGTKDCTKEETRW
jgi:hypothetical protein